MRLLTKLLQKAGYDQIGRGSLYPVMVKWTIVLFVLLGPLLSAHVDSFLTRFCVSTSTQRSSAASIACWVFASLCWGFFLYTIYRKSRANKFSMEAEFFDPQEDKLKAQGKDVQRMEDFREAYRRRQYIEIATDAVLSSVWIMYYEAFAFFTLATRHHWDIMKGECAGLTFSFIERIYALQFLKDLPFSVADIFDLYGKCGPNTDARPIRVLTSLASSLHWALIVAIIGFIWGKQIKKWFVAGA
jgi:hypothetical protein